MPAFAQDRAARLVSAGAALLNFTVLADSATEHYRGSFENPFMTLPLAASAAGVVLEIQAAAGEVRPSSWRRMVRAVSALVGLMGLGFHAFNVTKRVGGLSPVNVYYGAPAGAPGALILAGGLGSLAGRLSAPGARRTVGGLAALGLAGAVGEAALFHHRGAFHNRFMWLPMVLPPLAAAALAADVAKGRRRAATGVLLGLTAAMGLTGAGFHIWGVSRHMGGWRNWRQNLLDGPPIPAPPSFTGLAVAALGAWMLLEGGLG